MAPFRSAVLPPYSPDFNPIERLWLRLKSDFFADWIARTGQEFEERICQALNHVMTQPKKTASLCSIRKSFL
ncbi:transposase [Prosthecobacter dejongeii]|uniref:transposase n=1 Tax=Prosthecobacter dejongeii TaxID=48465 RepID=UPI001611B1DD